MSKNEEIKALKHGNDLLRNHIDELNILRRELELDVEKIRYANNALQNERDSFKVKIKDLCDSMDSLRVHFDVLYSIRTDISIHKGMSDAFSSVHDAIKEHFSEWL